MAEEKHTDKKRSPAGKLGYAAYKATDTAMEAVASVVRAILKIFGSAFIVILLSGMLFACIFAYYVKNCLVSEVDVSLSDYTINQASTIWYNDGSGDYKELVTLTGLETHDWVEYEQIPHYMEQAVVAIEDKNFYNHKGVDWFRTSGALIDMFFTMRKTYGGSTITQQVLKNVTGNDEVTVQRKLKEIFGALELEKRYDKKEIM